MVVGTSRGVQSFETTDIRNRGGLAPQWQAIPEAINFSHLGSLDGNPYALADTICLRTGKRLKRLETPYANGRGYHVPSYPMTTEWPVPAGTCGQKGGNTEYRT